MKISSLVRLELTRFGGHLKSEAERRSPQCQGRIQRTRRSFGGRWSSWSDRAGLWKGWLGSSSPQRGRYETGSSGLIWTRDVAAMG